MNGFDKKVFAVIVSWNGAGWISEAIASLQKSSVPIDIVIVDNASTDETVTIVAEAFQDVLLIRLDTNHGFAQANNAGIQHALAHGADYVFLLNQDAKVQPDTVGRLIEASEQHPDFGILSPIHLTYNGEGIEPAFFAFIKDHSLFATAMLLGRAQDVYETEFINAAVWLLPRQTLEKVGGFDPVFFMYAEDNDYCYRTRVHGLKIGFVPRAFAYHQMGSNDIPGMPFKKQYQKLSSQLIYLLKRPDHIFIFSCAGLLLAWTKRMVLQALDFDMKGAAACALSLFTVSLRIAKVYRHYLNCKRRGRIWLETGTST